MIHIIAPPGSSRRLLRPGTLLSLAWLLAACSDDLSHGDGLVGQGGLAGAGQAGSATAGSSGHAGAATAGSAGQSGGLFGGGSGQGGKADGGQGGQAAGGLSGSSGQGGAGAEQAGGQGNQGGLAGTSGGAGSSPTADADGDGWTIAQGDCNDNDPNVNPGAVDLVNYKLDANGKPTTELAATQIDEDCSGTAASPGDLSCDSGLAIGDTDAFDAARAMGLCNVKVEEAPSDPKLRRWGVISAGFNAISGDFFKTPLTPGLQVGILPVFGADTSPREGASLLGLSTGQARSVAQGASACPGTTANDSLSAAAPGFPKQSHCAGSSGNNPTGGNPYSGVALDLKIRVPTNARSLTFDYRFFSCEYPEYTCQSYNDVFAVIMTPSPLSSGPMYDAGTKSANIAFDANQNVIGVNNADFFTACEPDSNAIGYSGCKKGNGTKLAGSGFENHGASSWLTTQVNIPAGASVIQLRFATWNAGDAALQSTTMIDNFRWSTDVISTPVTVADP